MTLGAAVAAPAKGRISSPYGWRQLNGGPDLHTGIDIAAAQGSPAVAVLPGRVVKVGPISGYGQNAVVVEHPAYELFTLYGHMDSAAVSVGQRVRLRQMVGRVGTDGWRPENPARTVPPHLHFEFLDAWPPAGKDQNRLDPAIVFAALGLSYDEASDTFTAEPAFMPFLRNLLQPYPTWW